MSTSNQPTSSRPRYQDASCIPPTRRRHGSIRPRGAWCLLLAVLAAFATAAEARADLRVIKPGGNTVRAGAAYEVLWMRSNRASRVELTLVRASRAVGSSVILNGRRVRDYWQGQWRVPSGLAAGSGYVVVLRNLESREKGVSRPFTIAGAPSGSGASITLTASPRAGQTLVLTHEQTLSWTGHGTPARLRIRLERDGRHVNHISSNENIRGSFRWIVGKSYAPDEPTPPAGSGYRLVVETMDGALQVRSPSFSIRWPTIGLLYPNGGSANVRGDRDVNVQWSTSSDFRGRVGIMIELRTNLRRRTEIIGITDNDGSHVCRWLSEYSTRRNNWEAGDARILIYSEHVPALCDRSDAYFRTSNTR